MLGFPFRFSDGGTLEKIVLSPYSVKIREEDLHSEIRYLNSGHKIVHIMQDGPNL